MRPSVLALVGITAITASIGTWYLAGSSQAGALAEPVAAPEKLGARIFEQRIYHTREGLLPDLHARFRDHTNYLFVKHGMTLVGYWTPVDQPNTLIYMLAYPSRKARDASWKGFMADPDWKKAWADSKKKAGGALVTKVDATFLEPTDYSPIR